MRKCIYCGDEMESPCMKTVQVEDRTLEGNFRCFVALRKMRVVNLKRRPYFIRFFKSWREYVRIGVSPLTAVGMAAKISRNN